MKSKRNNLPSDCQTPGDGNPGRIDTLPGREAFANTLAPASPLPATRGAMGIPGGELQTGKGTKSPSV